MAFDFRTLVTDRTQQDVEYVRQLVDKLVTGTATESEKAEWNSFTLKGAYNYTDLNRVIAAMEDLKLRLEECGYVVPGYQRIKIERTNQSRLPEGSTELEYIESTGTQHIDTELITQSEKLRVECEFRYTAAHASTALFGNQKGTSSPYAFSFTLYGAGPDIYVGASAPATSITTEVGKTHRMILEADNGALTITLDGTITRSTYSGSLNHTLSTVLFGNNINGAVSQKCSARIKKWKAYDNGSLVRDFIPCKLSDGSVGLWDDVEGKFYGNAGTGTFVAGPAAEIVELEWIESTGTEYLDTGFIPNQDTRVVADFELVSPPLTYSVPFGVEDSSTQRFWVYVNSPSVTTANWQALYGSKETKCTPTGDGRQTVDFGKTGFLTKGVHTDLTASTFKCDRSIWLYCVHYRGDTTRYLTKAKYYSCQIYDNGLLVRDYVPAKTIEGEIGLYDRVFHEFYRNAGTGAFIAGPEMAHEDYTELEYVESSGTQYIDTGFSPNQNTGIRAKIEVTTQPTGNAWLFGCREASSSGRYSVFNAGSSTNLHFGFHQNTGLVTGYTIGTPYEIVVDGNVCTIGGASTTLADATFQNTRTIYISAENQINSVSGYTSEKIYYFQIYDNGTEIRIYIPMLHPSGIAGLWDAVNERFYASATTTDFMAGPEVVKAPGNSQTYLVRAGNEYDKELDPYLWYEGDSPTVSQMEQYIGNVAALKGVLKLMRSTPKVPSDMANLTVDEANHIEIILLTVDQMLTNMILTVDTSWATGTAYTGIYAKEAN